ncbi:hypothetical protein [Mycobacterium sp. SMC-4]|uniref:hypothetical protein n=1 Tax=Mycobacterium sp. SMC-4 TaxID=2857059 RepID=UPI003CFD11FA
MSDFESEPPGVQRRDVVLVAGPPAAGHRAVLARLRERLPGHRFVGVTELVDGEAPALVVFVASAVAVVTGSDCALARHLARYTAAVVGVVSKIDDHRSWRSVLAADRDALSDLVWVGAAAAPRLGPPEVDDLVAVVAGMLADPALATRNRLHAWHFELTAELAHEQAAAAGRSARTAALQQRRRELLREQRQARTERAIAGRHAVARARLELSATVQHRCACVREELSSAAAQADRRALADITRRVPEELAAACVDIDEAIASELAGLSDTPIRRRRLALDLPAPPVRSRRLETQLMTVLGAGFGLGVALASTRLVAGVAPSGTVAAVLVGLLAGAAVTVWVVRTRGLLHDRVTLERWIGQATRALRSAADIEVAERVLAVESAIATATAAADDALGDAVADLDAELRRQRSEAEAAEAACTRVRASRQQRLDALAVVRGSPPTVTRQ